MKIAYVGVRPQVNGAIKVAITQCNLLHKMKHEIRLLVFGADVLDWAKPLIKVEYISSLRNIEIADNEIIIALDCFATNWLVNKYGEERVISLIQTNEPLLYRNEDLIKSAKKSFMLQNRKIVVSKYLQNVLKEYNRNSCIIHPAIDTSIFFPRDRRPPDINLPFKVLVVGSYDHPTKQIPQAYRALEYLDSLGVKVNLVRLVRKAENIRPRKIKTQWHVTPSQEEIGEIYRSVDAVLIASKSEGFGLPILEAMTSGIPFVATDNGGSREFIEEEKLIEAGDIKAMGDALYKIATNQEHWLSLREMGLAKAKQWSWERSSIMLEKYIKSVYEKAFTERG